MVGRFNTKPRGRPAEANAAGEVIFRGSEGQWLTLVIVGALVALLTIWVVVSTLRDQGAGGLGWPLLLGGGLSALLFLGAWFSRTQRREVVVDGEGLTVRTREGRVKVRLAWAQVEKIEARPLPSHPTQPAILVHTADGASHFIDPLQVHDTSALLGELQRRKQSADDAARAATLLVSRPASSRPAQPEHE